MVFTVNVSMSLVDDRRTNWLGVLLSYYNNFLSSGQLLMEKNLIQDLLPAGAEDDELLQLLQRHYGSARSTPENDVVYPNTEKFALRVHCKSGKKKDIEPGPGFSNEELS